MFRQADASSLSRAASSLNRFQTMAPLERLGQPEDIASVVSFLAGPDGGWVNSMVLRANGCFA
jgi:3-oxoacyl-[acyl-carrier protein] reductase